MVNFEKVRELHWSCCHLNNMMKQKIIKVFNKYIFRVEKYRPQTLDDLISHQDILSTSKQ